ncbi:MAG TPA: cupredoxin domain-containing protein [Dehalococcoidia bacterium]|nr:cupredoxin domain-containing protein [Dehalococcoidia bacterium]
MLRSFMPAVLFVIVLAGAVAAACGGDDDGGGAAASPTRPAAAAASPTSAPAAASPTSAAGGTGNSITIADFSYSPARITVRAGQPVQLTVTNGGQFPHTFTVDNLVDSGSLAAGQTRNVTFTPPAAGQFTFYCTIHGQARMSGQLTVQGTTGAVPSEGAPAGQSTSASQPAGDATPATQTGYDYGY